jgi:hypothetical protein
MIQATVVPLLLDDEPLVVIEPVVDGWEVDRPKLVLISLNVDNLC